MADDTHPNAVVDAHAHHFPRWLPDMAARSGDNRWPRLEVEGDGASGGRIMLGEVTMRRVSASLFNLDARIAELDAAGVAVQVISPMPVLLTYWADPHLALDVARATNDAIANDVAASAGRLRGLGTVPVQDLDVAIPELRRLATELGLDGVEIGTHAGGRELDDPGMEPFWATVEELDVAVFIHPLEGGGGTLRRQGPPYDWALGMLTDTAMAATGLINGGVLDRHPTLRVMLAHGCGTFPWAFPRLRLGTRVSGDAGLAERYADLAKRLWVDSLVFDPEHLRLLAHRFGTDHVLFGTDHPFIPGQLDGARAFADQAIRTGALSPEAVQAMLETNALRFLRRGVVSLTGDRRGGTS